MSLDHHLFGLTSDFQWLPVRVNASGHVAMVDQPADAADVAPISAPWFYAVPSGGITDTGTYTLVTTPGLAQRCYVTSMQMQNVSATATEIVIKSGATVLWRGNLQASMIEPKSYRFKTPLRGGENEVLTVACSRSAAVHVNAQGYQDAVSSGIVYSAPSVLLLESIGAQGLTIDFSSTQHYATTSRYGDASVTEVRDAMALLYGQSFGLAVALSDTYFVASTERYGSAEVIA